MPILIDIHVLQMAKLAKTQVGAGALDQDPGDEMDSQGALDYYCSNCFNNPI